jgi:hypothetical protein
MAKRQGWSEVRCSAWHAWRRMPWGSGGPELEEVALVQALVTYRLDVEVDELDNRSEHHQTDSDIRVDPQRAR